MIDKPFRQPRLMSSQQHFSRVPKAQIPRSAFNRSRQLKTTFNSGDLIPIFVDEVLPGDTVSLRCTTFARLATPILPFMDNLYADVFFFYVPNRILWTNWEKFNGAQDNPGDSTDFLVPQVTVPSGGFLTGSMADYFGIPVGVNNMPAPNAFHFRAMNMIYNEWFRDQNLQDSVPFDTGNGPDAPTDYVIKRRGRRHDYFTSALPFTQKGPAVLLPLGDFAPLTSFNFTTGVTSDQIFARAGASSSANTGVMSANTSTGDMVFFPAPVASNSNLYWPQPGDTPTPTADNIVSGANLSEATAATINQLREAFQMQRMFERDARGGTRFTEILLAHFGVSAPDFRLQRPEYLGGGHAVINTSPIPQTSATGETGGATPQGNLAAMGTFSHHGIGFHKSFVEHGVLIGLVSVRADYTYQQGLNRMWTRQTRFDYYWPSLSHLGEQAVLNQEIYCQSQSVVDGSGNPVNQDVFGYQERFAEYRYGISLVTGQMRSTATSGTPIDFWHLADHYSNLPVLGDTFIQENPPVNRVLAVTDAAFGSNQFVFDAVFDSTWARPMPVYSVPGLIDHF